MICALTVRKLKPDTFEDFMKDFGPPKDQEPMPGFKAFYALRNVDDPNEVITFGLFEGTAEDLRSTQDDRGYDERRAKADEFVESVGADGMYEVVEERKPE
jgi:heme-degrading monooxygenase HmoA